MDLKTKLNEWCQKVLRAKEVQSNDDSSVSISIDTYRMLRDVDQILAEAFDHEPVLEGTED